MRILICGSRDWEFPEIIRDSLETHMYAFPTIIEGEATGADADARDIAHDLALPVEPYPADWTKYKRAAGPIRNQQMLDKGKPDTVWAFFKNIERSRGTCDMVTRALRAGLPVFAVEARVIPENELRERLGLEEKTTAPDK